MTGQEIDAMPAGVELDALVAEALGAPCGHAKTTWHRAFYPDTGTYAGYNVEICDICDQADPESWPAYSTDIAAAWPLVERYGMIIAAPHGENCSCKGRPWRASRRGGTLAEGETAPLAICRAALKAAGRSA